MQTRYLTDGIFWDRSLGRIRLIQVQVADWMFRLLGTIRSTRPTGGSPIAVPPKPMVLLVGDEW